MDGRCKMCAVNMNAAINAENINVAINAENMNAANTDAANSTPPPP